MTALGYVTLPSVATVDDAMATSHMPGPGAELMLFDVVDADGKFGLDAFQGLRERLSIPVVALVPPALGADIESEPSRALVRPFTPRELHTTIELALRTHEATRAVAEIEERFFAVSVDLLCFLDFSGFFRRLNPAWHHTLGFSIDELMSRPFIEFVHPDDRERTLEQNRRVRSGERALAFENRYLCKDGSFRWLRWNATPDTAYRTIYSVARDMTETKRIEEERNALVVELQTALAEVATLKDILPMCSYCRRVRDDENYWHSVESYIARHTKSRFSHGICPGCMTDQIEPQLREIERQA